MSSVPSDENRISAVTNLEICPRCHEYVRGLVTPDTWQCPKCRATRAWAVYERNMAHRPRPSKNRQIKLPLDTRPRSWGINTPPPVYPEKRRRMKKAQYLRLLRRFSLETEARRMGHKFRY